MIGREVGSLRKIASVRRKFGRKSAAYRLSAGKVSGQGDRQCQEDSLAFSPPELYSEQGFLAVLSDGMGGMENGDLVSGTVTSSMMRQFSLSDGEPTERLAELFDCANRKVNRVLGMARIGTCGATVVAGLFYQGKLYYASVGDSRICLYRNGELLQLNREHIYQNELILRMINGNGTFDEAKSHPHAAGLTSFFGMGQLKYLDLPAKPLHLLPDDCVALMSDGVYRSLSGEEICRALALRAEDAAEEIGRMIEEKKILGQDNYSAIIIRCEDKR